MPIDTAKAIHAIAQTVEKVAAKPLTTSQRVALSGAVAVWLDHAYQQGRTDATPADHRTREAVNQLREIAVSFHATQQLRQRIAEVVLDLVKGPL